MEGKVFAVFPELAITLSVQKQHAGFVASHTLAS